METYFATCPQSVLPLVSKELQSLGAQNISEQYMAVRFDADREKAYRIHLQCSTASHLLRLIKDCPAKTPKILFDKAKRIAWSQYLPKNKTFRIDGIAGDRGEEFMSSNEISKQVRSAIVDYFEFQNLPCPKVDIKNPDIVIHVFVRNKRASISLATSGRALHKRGYRLAGHPAPLQETLAASLLQTLGYTGEQVLVDPMTGSGTFAIEAAMIALNKSVQIHRGQGTFGLEHIGDFDKALWRKTCDDLRSEATQSLKQPIFASDINSDFIKMAQDNALRARVEKYIDFDSKTFFDLEKPAETGILVANLPYGKRIGDELQEMYQRIGDHLKQNFSGWRAGLLMPAEAKGIGLRPTKTLKLNNGGLQTKFMIFDLYAGSRRH